MMSLYNILEMHDLYDWIIQGNVLVSILQTKKNPHQLNTECEPHLAEDIVHPFFLYKEL